MGSYDLVEDTGALKVVFELFKALNSSVLDFADLVRVELCPSLSMEVPVEVKDEQRMQKVDEGVAHISLVLEIYWQVQKIVLVLVPLVDLVQQISLVVLVRNVFNHKGCS
jgi:hypothetical protein